MSQTKIAIIVEVKKREMPFFSVLQKYLEDSNYKVELIPFRSMCAWRLIKFRPDIVVVNGIRTIYPYFIKQIYIPKLLFQSKIICYYSEQIGYYNTSIAEGYNNQLVLKNVDYHVAWGKRFTEDLIKLGVDSTKCWFIGSLQYDVDKYLRLSDNAIKKELASGYDLNPDSNWIIYTDNIVKNYQKKDIYPIRRNDTLNMVKNLSEKMPDKTIIFRPHPDTSEEEIQEISAFIKHLPNVKLISERHILYWVKACEVLVMWVSTSSLQAMFSGKLVYGFKTSDGQDEHKYWYKDIFPIFTDGRLLANEISDKLQSTTPVSAKSNEQEEYIRNWYFKNDGLTYSRFLNLVKIVEHENFHEYVGEIFSKSTIVKILYYEVRAFIGDFFKNRGKDRAIYKSDIIRELKVFDTNRIEKNELSRHYSDSGYYFE